MLAYEICLEGVAFSLVPELEQEALFEIACPDADGIETLDNADDALEELFRKFGSRADDPVKIELEITVVVNAADKNFSDASLAAAESGESELFEQVFLERLVFFDGIHHELVVFIVDLRADFPVSAEVFIPIGEFCQLTDFAFFTQFFTGGFVKVGGLFDLGGLALESGILVHLLADHGLEIKNRGLEDSERLEHLRSERLLHPLFLNLS
jgi:hypothetical protein